MTYIALVSVGPMDVSVSKPSRLQIKNKIIRTTAPFLVHSLIHERYTIFSCFLKYGKFHSLKVQYIHFDNILSHIYCHANISPLMNRSSLDRVVTIMVTEIFGGTELVNACD